MKFAASAGWVLFGLTSVAGGVYAQNSITALDIDGIGNGTTIIKVELAQPLSNLPAGAGFTLSAPPRIVLDFPDTANGLGKSVQDFIKGGVRSASIVQTGGSTRLVIYLDQMFPNNIKIDGSRLLIALQGNAVDAGSNTLRLAETSQGTQKLPAKAEHEARKPAEIETQAKNPAAPLPQPSPMLASESPENLLREANALLKGGKPADAYNLLEPKEADYSGEITFDYLLGIAALDSGKPDRATIAFERVLAVNPNFAGARIDLARAYFAMGSFDIARNEFEIVLTQNPPEQTVAVIKKYIETIDEYRKAKLQQVSFYLETNMGHDSNITAATSDFTGGVFEAFQIPGVIATGSSIHRSAMFAGVSGGVDLTRVVSEENGINLFAGADVRQRSYNGVAEMNNRNLDLRAGVGISSGDNSYRVTGTFGKYLQSGFTEGTNSNRDTTGLGAEWKHSFDAHNQMIWSLQYNQPRYLMTPTQDTNQATLSGSLLHVFEGSSSPLIFANANRSVDRALHPSNAIDSNMGRTTTGVLAHFQFTPLANTDFFLSAGLTVRQDDSPNARSLLTQVDYYGRDLTQNVSFGFTARPWTKWSIKGAVISTSNKSNLLLYQYNRVESSVSLRRDF